MQITMPLHIYGPRQFHRTGTNWSCAGASSARICMPHRNTQKCPMGQWLYHYISWDQNRSVKFEMEQIASAVIEVIAFARNWVPDRNAQKGSTGQWLSLHIYGPWQCHRTWDEADRSSSYEFTASTKSEKMDGWTESILKSPLPSLRKAGDKIYICTHQRSPKYNYSHQCSAAKSREKT